MPERKTRAPKQKKEVIEVEGVIKDALPNAMFDVELANAHHVLAHVSGRMKMHYIRILLGDRVLVELSPYDLTRGRRMSEWSGIAHPGSACMLGRSIVRSMDSVPKGIGD